LKSKLEDLTRLPAEQTDRSYFSDWGDPREYSLGDLGIGECAGEVVSSVEFDLATAEREVFEAQVAFDNGETARAAELAHQSMVHAARGLVKIEFSDVPDDAERIVQEFRARFYDTQKFFDPFAGGKFAQYFFAAHEKTQTPRTPEVVRYLIEEAQLFIEASHSCYNRMAAPANA